MANVSKVLYKRITESIDSSTGELDRYEEESVARFNSEPPYVKMYLDDICALVSVPNSLRNVLVLCLRKLDYEGYITLSTRYRKQMCAELGIKDPTLRNKLYGLSKKGFIFSVGGGEFKANPNLFARGEWKNIIEQRKAFEMIIKYSPDGDKTITTKISNG